MAVSKALIFAAGYGKRMRPLTEQTPKPLLKVADKPLIVHHIEKLVGAGIHDLVINTHWLSEKLIAELGDGHQFGASIHWSYEPEILDTGGGVKNALPLLGDDPFLIVNGDIWTDYDFGYLANKKLPEESAHLVMVPNPAQHASGDFSIDAEGMLSTDEDFARRTYSGMGLFSPGFINQFSSQARIFPLRETLKAGMACGKVSAELYQGGWEDVGTPERLEMLNTRIGNK